MNQLLQNKIDQIIYWSKQKEEAEAKLLQLLGVDKEFGMIKRPKKMAGKFGIHNPMTEEVKKEIRDKFESGFRVMDLAREYGVAEGAISKILKKEPNYITGENTNMMKDPKTDKRSKENREKRSEPIAPIRMPPENGRNKLTDLDKEFIKNRISEGIKVSDVAKEFNVSTALVYIIKREVVGAIQHKKPKELPSFQAPLKTSINEYMCDIGHRFKSNLAPGEPTCPRCGSHETNLCQPAPVNEGYSAGHSNFSLKE